jgi:hypothetical protein
MEVLAKKIADGLKRAQTFTISPEELKLVWPVSFEEQEEKVRAFAQRNGWLLASFNHEGAIIMKKGGGF